MAEFGLEKKYWLLHLILTRENGMLHFVTKRTLENHSFNSTHRHTEPPEMEQNTHHRL